jgi:hypothetical protein
VTSLVVRCSRGRGCTELERLVGALVTGETSPATAALAWVERRLAAATSTLRSASDPCAVHGQDCALDPGFDWSAAACRKRSKLLTCTAASKVLSSARAVATASGWRAGTCDNEGQAQLSRQVQSRFHVARCASAHPATQGHRICRWSRCCISSYSS